MTKAHSGTLTQHSGDRKIYASLIIKLWSGTNFCQQFSSPCIKVPSQVRGWVRGGGVILNLLMLITFLFSSECFDIFTISRRPPVLQTDAHVGMN